MSDEKTAETIGRRAFLARAGTAALGWTIVRPGLVRGSGAASKIRLGVIGCGGRGTWLAGLFAKHGGYDVAAAADYFPERAAEFGARFGIPEARRFSGLSGYKRLFESGAVDAVAIESPPWFHPGQAAAAVEAGVHVYLAKPAAVDGPGCRKIAASGRAATRAKKVFLVDFQTRAHPIFMEALKRVHGGALGEIVFGEATYHADCPFEEHYDLVRSAPGEAATWLRAWGLDRALSGDIITEQEIHALDVMSWIMGVPPLSAFGSGGLKARPKLGTCWDHFVVYYQYPGGVAVQFSGKQFKGHGTPEGINNRMFGSKGVLETQYGGNVMIRGENYYRGGGTSAIYEEGAVNNIEAFHAGITRGEVSNPTVEPAVQSNLITILGRKAAYENRLVTWQEILDDDEALVPNLKGLKD